MNHLWYVNPDGSPKSYRRPRTCESCRDHPKGGCMLPVRKQRKVRWLAALESKPMFFNGLWFSSFRKRFSKGAEK